jgi:hypothetical protein
MGRLPDGTWTNYAELYCRDSLWFYWGEPVNVAFDGRMTGTGYLGENTLLMTELWAGAFLFIGFVMIFWSQQVTWKYAWDYRTHRPFRSDS